MSGRRTKQESRADELRRKLIVWKEIPESLRPSLRALAAEIDASHQLLSFYLKGLDEWQARNRYLSAKRNALQRAQQIRARATAENREMTMSECCDAIIVPGVMDQIEDMRQKSKHGPLHSAEFKILKIWAKRGFPGAQELLEKRAQIGVKQRKSFGEIVRATPRQEGEAPGDWVRRIWAECDKYETNIPVVITEELLGKYSRRVDKKHGENLPLNDEETAKSFRSVGGKGGNSAKVLGRRAGCPGMSLQSETC